MKLISWNVNGLRAILGKNFMEAFTALDADVFCLQETKLQAGQHDLDLPGYHQYWNYAEKKGYSGTAVFTRVAPISVRYGIGVEEHDHEGRVITLEFEDFYLITVYVPNAQRELTRLAYRMTWEDAFLSYIRSLEAHEPMVCRELNAAHTSSTPQAKKKPIIICGDLNVAANPIDLKNPQANQHNAGYTAEERGKFRNLLDAGFVDTFRMLHPDEVKYSWWSYMFKARERNAGWRIDYFLASADAKDRIAEADILTDIQGSDHCPVLLRLND